MYKVVHKIPKTWDVHRRGNPLIVLEDEYGGQSVIGLDDHCFVLYNGSEDRPFRMVKYWYPEAAYALNAFLSIHQNMSEIEALQRCPLGCLLVCDCGTVAVEDGDGLSEVRKE